MTTQTKPRRVGRLTLMLGSLALAGSTALLTWWTTTLWGLPDVGDPFDVASFSRPIPDDTNAFVLYRQAAAILPEEPGDAVYDWKLATQAKRDWVERSREALALWWKGTGRHDALEVDPSRGTFESSLKIAQDLRSFGRAALLEGSRLEDAGDLEGAFGWYEALLRSSRHTGRRGFFIARLIGIAMHRWVSTRLERWAADPRVDARLVRRALDAAIEADAATPPPSDGVKAEYLIMMHSIEDPELMARTADSIGDVDGKGSSIRFPGQLGWKAGAFRVRRRVLDEPERSRRVIRMIFANWLAACDLPASRRPPKVLAKPKINGKDPAKALLCDLYALGPDAPARARALPPAKLATWFASTVDAEMCLPACYAIEQALARERSAQGHLVVTLANELYKRERGEIPSRIEDLVGPYLKALPEGYLPPK